MNRWAEYRAGTLTPPVVVQHDVDGADHLIWVYTTAGIKGPYKRTTYDEVAICDEVMELVTTAEEQLNALKIMFATGPATYVYTTLIRMRRVMRFNYRREYGLQRLRAARWLIENCTDAQLMNVFDLANLAQAAVLRTRLENKVAYLTAWEAKQAELNAAEALVNSVEED